MTSSVVIARRLVVVRAISMTTSRTTRTMCSSRVVARGGGRLGKTTRVARARESRREAAAVVTDADAGAGADADAVWYVERALTDEDVRTVVEFLDAEKTRKSLKREKGSLATKRRSAALPPASAASAVFSSARLLRTLRGITGEDALVLGDYPIELRACDVGSEMDWHRDVVMYEPAQWECVFTVRNDSDSETEWIVDEGTGETRAVRTSAGSVIVVRAGGAMHRVLPSTRGERVVVKALYTTETRVKTDAFSEILDSAPWRR